MFSVRQLRTEREVLLRDFAPAPTHGRFTAPYTMVVVTAALTDCFAFVASMWVGRALYAGLHGLALPDIGAGLVALLAFCMLAQGFGLYRPSALLAPRRVIGRLAGAALAGAFGVYVVLNLLELSDRDLQKVLLVFTVLGPIFVTLGRSGTGFGAQAAIGRGLVGGRSVVLITDQAEIEHVAPVEFLNYGVNVMARFILSRREGSNDLSDIDAETVRRAIEFASEARAQEFAVILPWSRNRALGELIALLRKSPLPARLYPDSQTRAILVQRHESRFDPSFAVEIQRAPLNAVERFLKRSFDIVVSGLAILMLSPFLFITAAMIRLDSPGPAIFRQRRRGFNNRDFMIWKFRTMRVMEDGATIVQARRADERFTALGAVLRKTSVDELPQLMNVLRGEMSLVGPRPHAVAHDEKYGRQIADYAFRHHVKPGLSGYAQVCGHRGETKTLEQMEKRVEHDLWYINNWSFWLDIKIILRTFAALLSHEAY